MPFSTSTALPRRFLCLLLFLGVVLPNSPGFAEPQITGTSPRAVKPGEAIDVTITGKELAGASELWTSFPAEVSLSPEVKDNGEQDRRIVFRVKATDPNIVGVHAVRVVSPKGISPLQVLVVDDLPSVAQEGGNKSLEAAQTLSLPVAVDGRVDNLSRNFYRFSAEVGQRVSIEVLARRMGSALDPMIRLLRADGRELAYSDDSPGLLGDARLCHTFAEAGDYLLEVRDIRFQGGGGHVYRLRMGDFPCINVPYPLGVRRGEDVTLEFAGPDLEGVEPLNLSVPEDPDLDWLTVGAKRAGGTSRGFASVSIGDAEEILEKEPNNTPEQAQKTTLKANFNGRLQQPDDVDRFTFPAKKGQKFTFAAVTRSQGSPADLVLQMFDETGKKIGQADDAGSEDAVLNVTFPANGNFTLAVEDLHGRGGPAFAYRIAVSETQPGFALEAVNDSMNVPQNGVVMIPIVARRSGYNGPIAIRAEGLPEGVTLCPSLIGPGQKGINLCLESSDAAKSGTLHDVKILGEAEIGGKTVTRAADLSLALKSQTNQMPYPPANLLDSLALAVAPSAPFSLRVEPEEITFGRDLSAKVKVIAERQKDYNDAIKLEVTPVNVGGSKPASGLPPNVKADLKPIPKDQSEVEITLTATDKAPQGEFTIVLDGTLKKGKTTIKQPASALAVKLQKALSLAIEPANITLEPGSKEKVRVKIERNPALTAEVEVSFKNLPAGISAPKTTIPAEQNSIEVELTAANDAKSATAKNVTVQAQAKADGKTFSAASDNVTVKIP